MPYQKICEYCDKHFVANTNKQKFCGLDCARTSKKKRNDSERPYEKETAYLIRLWYYKQGDSVQKIAQALGRSVENVKKALV